MFYSIQNNDLKITVNSFGAELSSVVYKGKEFIWQNDNGGWEGHDPVLFPFCGHFGVTVYGKTYPMLPHGFAYTCGFALIEKKDNLLRFSISSSKETKKYYPFDFIFDVIYTIENNKLKVEYEIFNPSEEIIGFACGGHESYNVGTDLEDCYLEFEEKEHFVNLDNNDDGYLTGKNIDFGVTDKISFKKYPLINELTFIFKNTKNKSLTLKKNDGTKIAKVSFRDFNNILFWRPNGAKMVCIEPWTNLPDSVNEEKCEFIDKEGVISVEPGKKVKVSREVEYY